MNPLGLIRQFIKGLTTETEPPQIALGVAFGFLIGLLTRRAVLVASWARNCPRSPT